MGATVTERRHSTCDLCRRPIAITIDPGQRWDEVDWEHVGPMPPTSHRATPELRFAIDAACPNCGHPEIGFSPASDLFVCSRCKHTQTERPKD